VQWIIISNLQFAGDNAESERDLQLIVDRIARESNGMGMKININKTEVTVSKSINVLLEGSQLKQVENFVYLGRKTEASAGTEAGTGRRISLACDAVQRLQSTWQFKGISYAMKDEVYD